MLPGPNPTYVASTATDTTVSLPGDAFPFASATWQSLTDVTGDGRPDLVYRQGNQLVALPNVATGGGGSFFDSPVALPGLSAGPLEKLSARAPRFSHFNADQVWREGRLPQHAGRQPRRHGVGAPHARHQRAVGRHRTSKSRTSAP